MLILIFQNCGKLESQMQDNTQGGTSTDSSTLLANGRYDPSTNSSPTADQLPKNDGGTGGNISNYNLILALDSSTPKVGIMWTYNAQIFDMITGLPVPLKSGWLSMLASKTTAYTGGRTEIIVVDSMLGKFKFQTSHPDIIMANGVFFSPDSSRK